jgi:uncharacterized protein
VILLIVEYILVGALAGLLAGLLGVGGGIIIIPALVFIFSTQTSIPSEALMLYVVGTSLASIIATTIFSLSIQHRRGFVSWAMFLKLLPGIVIGTVLGILLANFLDTHVLKALFGVFMILMAAQTFFRFKQSRHEELPGRLNCGIASIFIGLSSGLLGIGGGALTVPYLTYFKISIRQAMAASTACGIVIAVTGMVGYIITGLHQVGAPAWSSGYVYWPAVLAIGLLSPFFVMLGAKLSQRLPVEILRRIFAIFIFIVGLQMLF